MKTYDLYHEDDHSNELCANVRYESDTGHWVPAEVAQALYDALKRLEESARMVMAGEMEKSSIMVERMAAQSALALADGDNT